MLTRISHIPLSQYLRKFIVLITVFAFLAAGTAQSSLQNSRADNQKQISGMIASQPPAALIKIHSKERVSVHSSAGFVFAITIQSFPLICPAGTYSFYRYIPSFKGVHRYARFSRATFS
jgi:hypothetical protein